MDGWVWEWSYKIGMLWYMVLNPCALFVCVVWYIVHMESKLRVQNRFFAQIFSLFASCQQSRTTVPHRIGPAIIAGQNSFRGDGPSLDSIDSVRENCTYQDGYY